MDEQKKRSWRDIMRDNQMRDASMKEQGGRENEGKTNKKIWNVQVERRIINQQPKKIYPSINMEEMYIKHVLWWNAVEVITSVVVALILYKWRMYNHSTFHLK